jgi:CDP-glucose 4,6-dehydratase
MKKLFGDTYKGKTVLVTGHTGFKGSWLCIWLKELGANVIGYALEPYTPNDNFVAAGLEGRISSNIGDIRDYERLKSVFDTCHPEIVFHLAAQPLVRLSYREPKLTYDTNIGGTINLLECCRLSESVKVIVNVTSDKCYENKEWTWGYRENDALGGYDPYSSSKGCSEIITAAYRNSFFTISNGRNGNKSISSVRAGNVIGGGDWQEDRLVPDCVKALKRNEAIGIRSPGSIRPWQHVLEPLGGYLLLAARMWKDGDKYAGAWNFGPDLGSMITVGQLVEKLLACWGSGSYKDLSEGLDKEPHETRCLMLDISKAAGLLRWKPTLTVDQAIELTVDWYKAREVNYDFCVRQINEYMDRASQKHGLNAR